MRFCLTVLTLFCILSISFASEAPGKFEGCLKTMIRDVKSQNATGYGIQDLRDDDGKALLNISQADTATGMSYSSCIVACGDQSHTTSWVEVGQQTGAWVLPSLAIIAQLPFGAHSSLDDWIAVILTLGCPALAAYSLALTVLNGQWITRRFDGVAFGAASDAVRCLRSLQQTPIQLGRKSLLASLVVLPRNDRYWNTLADSLDEQGNTWTVPVIISLGWVAIAYLLTISISFTELVNVDVSVNGLAVGAAWCFLLAIVAGWLMVSPKSDARRNAKCLREANAIAHIAPEDESEPSDLQGICLEHDPSYTKHRAFELIEEPDILLLDQMCSQPIYNYARFYTWTAISRQVHQYYRNAHFQRFNSHTVHGGMPDRHDDARNRSGTISQVIEYCEDDKFTPVDSLGGRYEDWVIACGLALGLQWGTIGSAILAFVVTPTTGLGCRSLSYLIYGSVATLAWILFLISGWLAFKVQLRTQPNDYARSHPKFVASSSSMDTTGKSTYAHPQITAFYRFLSIVLRRIAKTLTTINAMGFVAICFIQFTGTFNKCYCNSSVIGRGADHAFNLVLLKTGTAAMRHMTAGLAGSVVLSFGCGAGFASFLRFRLKPKRISDPHSYA
ncbi:hypothetical protein DL96DRAFT_1818992 [Flagelloscypha sp. PMI_526]|nr:hypothetical protein DL96DRAFT_1818992 [Flagelloscypha sp. PMI_526]